ncbi:MAG: hypothetical protein F6K19_19490 [Cyanothece sp. SIO1E1]|nr:hypothetical protein [Cyanothece sp. SIO1E1]
MSPANTEEDGMEDKNPIKLSFLCVPIEGVMEEDIYRSVVHVVAGNRSEPVVLLPTCNLLGPAHYAKHQIPKGAIAAASSWWAGSGDYVYALPTEEGVLIRRAVVDEMQLVRDYGYMDWALWQQDTLIRYDASSMMPITGLYTGGGHDVSYLLLLDRVGEEWKAEGVELPSMLPPMEDLRVELEDLKWQEISDFKLEAATGHFSAGEWGEGALVMEDGRYVLVFKDKLGPDGTPLKLAFGMR